MKLEDAKYFITALYPDKSVDWNDKGQMNYIAIVDKQYVYKFPKTPENFKLLQKEYALYELLKDKINLDIPKPILLDEQRQFLQLNYIGGLTLSEEQAAGLTPRQQSALAIKLATFVKVMNSDFVQQGFKEIAAKDTNDFYYVENWLKKIAEYCMSHPSELSQKYIRLYKEFSTVLPYGFCIGTLIAHKDLHEGNMLFNKDHELVGLIDFAEVRYTSIYSELRTVIRFGLDVVEQILDQVGALVNGAKAAEVLLFAKVYELAIIVQDNYIKKELPWRVDQANFYLKKWEVL